MHFMRCKIKVNVDIKIFPKLNSIFKSPACILIMFRKLIRNISELNLTERVRYFTKENYGKKDIAVTHGRV